MRSVWWRKQAEEFHGCKEKKQHKLEKEMERWKQKMTEFGWNSYFCRTETNIHMDVHNLNCRETRLCLQQQQWGSPGRGKKQNKMLMWKIYL